MKRYGKGMLAVLLSVILSAGAFTSAKAEGASAGKSKEIGSSYVVGNKAFIFYRDKSTEDSGMETGGNDGSVSTGDSDNSIEITPLKKNEGISKRTVTEDGKVAARAYYKSKGLSGYAFPNVTYVGELSYARSNLWEAVLPYGLKTIGYGAFYHCDRLTKVQIPVTVTEIAPKAFSQSAWLKNWLAGTGDDFLIVGDGILLAYRGEAEEVTIPEGVKKIGPEVFMGDTRITSVVLPDSVTEVGEAAFYNCSNLTTVTGGSGLAKIADRAFAGCPVSGFVIGAGVKELGLRCIDFTDTALPEEECFVVFESTDALPVVSYEETAEKMANTSYRDVCLKGVNRIEHTEEKTDEEFTPYLQLTEAEEGLKINNQVSGKVTADFTGKGSYVLTVVEQESSDAVETAYESLYGGRPEGEKLTVTFSLTDAAYPVPIEQLNKGKLTLNVTLPDYLKYSNIRVLTVDKEGQLENISYTGEEGKISFPVTHTGDYVFLSVSDSKVYGQTKVNGGQAVIERNKDFGIE